MTGWIEHNGGDCPVEDDVKVSIVLRSGWTDSNEPASSFRWSHDGSLFDIVRYKVEQSEEHVIKTLYESLQAYFELDLYQRKGSVETAAQKLSEQLKREHFELVYDQKQYDKLVSDLVGVPLPDCDKLAKYLIRRGWRN